MLQSVNGPGIMKCFRFSSVGRFIPRNSALLGICFLDRESDCVHDVLAVSWLISFDVNYWMGECCRASYDRFFDLYFANP